MRLCLETIQASKQTNNKTKKETKEKQMGENILPLGNTRLPEKDAWKAPAYEIVPRKTKLL